MRIERMSLRILHLAFRQCQHGLRTGRMGRVRFHDHLSARHHLAAVAHRIDGTQFDHPFKAIRQRIYGHPLGIACNALHGFFTICGDHRQLHLDCIGKQILRLHAQLRPCHRKQ